MLRVKFGGREWQLDDAAPLTMGDIVALREMGVTPDRFGVLLHRLAGVKTEDMSGADLLELAESAAQIAYLAAVREDHSLKWRDFVWSLPMDDLGAFDLGSNTATPATATANGSGGVGAALAEAGAVKATARKQRPKKP